MLAILVSELLDMQSCEQLCKGSDKQTFLHKILIIFLSFNLYMGALKTDCSF